MKNKTRIKHLIDLCMAIALLLLMAGALLGEEAHEWIGVTLFALVVAHNVLNANWYRNLLKGRYTPLRIFQLMLDLSIAVCMMGLMVSGIIMSGYVFAFLPIQGGSAFARVLHMVCAYWGFVFMALHVGLHVNRMTAAIRKAVGIRNLSTARKIVLRAMSALLCEYGAYAFFRREIGSYMLLRTMFVFFNFSEPLAFFLVDYLAVMGMLMCVGHFVSEVLRKIPAGKTVKKERI